MWHFGIDLHRRTVIEACAHGSVESIDPLTFGCRDVDRLMGFVRRLQPYRDVIEATPINRWLDELLSPSVTNLLVYPAKLRLMIQRRTKTDKLGG